ncbi:MAG: hypothetical protein MJ116_02845 [Lachnospiraceae bacterium]|nr:hypothetical protein [Lachnospiraceae bacterium]
MEEKDVKKPAKNCKKPKEKISLIEAAKSGNKEKTLIALRDKLAESIETCESGRDIAANSKRLMEVMGELEEIKAEKKAKREKKAAAKNPSKRDQLRALNAK